MHRNTYIKYLYKQGYVTDYGIVGYVFNLNSPYGFIPGTTYINGLMCKRCDELKTVNNCGDTYCGFYDKEDHIPTNHKITEYDTYNELES